MSKHERRFTKQTKDYGELQIASGQVWYDFEPANEETEALIVALLAEIGAVYPTKSGRRKLVLVMSDVIMAARHAPTGIIMWPMDTSYFTGGPYGADFARLIRDRLIDAGYLQLKQKSSKWDKLARLYEASLPRWVSRCSFKAHKHGPVLEVRSPQRRDAKGWMVGGRRLSLKQFEPEIVRPLLEARTINEMMSQFPLAHPDGRVFTRCRRVFNEGSLQKGGRYYGAWQNCSEDERLTMEIDGSPVAEIDLKACFLVVLCQLYNRFGQTREKITLPFDPYSLIPFVRGCNDPQRRKRMRDLAKLLVSSVIADKADLTKFPKGKKTRDTEAGNGKRRVSVREHFQLGKDIKAEDLYGQVLDTFPFIKWSEHRIFDLMYRESEIIGQTILRLYRYHKIPTYPVHDCLMCRVQDFEQVLHELSATAYEMLGSAISLDVTFPDRPTEYYKAVGPELVRCNNEGDVKWDKFTWGLSDDDFEVVES